MATIFSRLGRLLSQFWASQKGPPVEAEYDHFSYGSTSDPLPMVQQIQRSMAFRGSLQDWLIKEVEDPADGSLIDVADLGAIKVNTYLRFRLENFNKSTTILRFGEKPSPFALSGVNAASCSIANVVHRSNIQSRLRVGLPGMWDRPLAVGGWVDRLRSSATRPPACPRQQAPCV